jgi:arylsulfatase A-like enzyme
MPFPRAKGTCYDPGIHVPLLVRFPGRVKSGAVYSELISHVDFAPSFLELAGQPKSAKMQGQSFLPLLTGGAYSPREAVYSERNWHDNFDPIRCVRTRTHKLIFNAAPHFPYRPAWDIEDGLSWQAIWKMRRRDLAYQHRQMLMPTRPLIEMYDLASDPGEFQNLAGSPAHASIRAGLEKKLATWMEATLDYLPPTAAAPGTPAGRNWPNSL